MMIKRCLLIAALAIAAIASLGAEQLTTVGVVDINAVYTAFFRDTDAVRELENLKASIQQELDSHVAILRRLQEQKIEAENAGREGEALRLDNEIYEKQQFIREFQQVKQRQLNDRRQRLLSNNDSFLSQLQSAISFVAEANGFTIVVSANDDKLLWWSQEVDITNLVLERLRASR